MNFVVAFVINEIRMRKAEEFCSARTFSPGIMPVLDIRVGKLSPDQLSQPKIAKSHSGIVSKHKVVCLRRKHVSCSYCFLNLLALWSGKHSVHVFLYEASSLASV